MYVSAYDGMCTTLQCSNVENLTTLKPLYLNETIHILNITLYDATTRCGLNLHKKNNRTHSKTVSLYEYEVTVEIRSLYYESINSKMNQVVLKTNSVHQNTIAIFWKFKRVCSHFA